MSCDSNEKPTAISSDWRLIEILSPTKHPLGAEVISASADAYEVALTVRGKGVDDCDAPHLSGFSVNGPTLVAQFVRSPTTSLCAVAHDMTFRVLLARPAIPPGVTSVNTNEQCQAGSCQLHSAVLRPPSPTSSASIP